MPEELDSLLDAAADAYACTDQFVPLSSITVKPESREEVLVAEPRGAAQSRPTGTSAGAPLDVAAEPPLASRDVSLHSLPEVAR